MDERRVVSAAGVGFETPIGQVELHVGRLNDGTIRVFGTIGIGSGSDFGPEAEVIVLVRVDKTLSLTALA
jgi:hypothetical protein